MTSIELRKLTARQLENKLDVTLKELKKVKTECQQLLLEREENEQEVIKILGQNSALKVEMTEIHKQYLEVVYQRDQLQIIVDKFDQDSGALDDALRRIAALESELCDSHKQIMSLECVNEQNKESRRMSLFDELIVSEKNNENSVSGLDKDTDLPNATSKTKRLVKCSNKKLKKYVKLNKIIRKTNNLIKQNRFSKRLNVKLVNKLNMYTKKLESRKLKYETDTRSLELQLLDLNLSLKSLSNEYENSQKLLEEYSLKMDELIKLSTDNVERFESLTNNNPCNCNQMSGLQSVGSSQSSVTVCDSLPPVSCREQHDGSNISLKNETEKPNLVMYSDEIGSDMGYLLDLYSKGLKVINNCLPCNSLNCIMKKVTLDYNINNNTTLIIFVGNRGSVNKNDLIRHYKTLNNLDVKKIVIFTLPYCNQLSQSENDIRYKLNLTFDLFTYNNKFHIIDSNKYVRNCYTLRRSRYHLTTYCKRQIAMSLSYYIDISAKNLANNNTASIEQTDVNNSLN